MWIVYKKEAPARKGFEVPTEAEAMEFCRDNPGYTYCYMGRR